jgi:serine/threonine protein kinase
MDSVDNRQVALKFPLAAMAQDQVFRAGFLREAWIGATVRSRWTIGYIDVPPERRRSLYLVMPYYCGATLEERLLAPPPVSFIDGIGIGLKLCEAVEDLARSQVIHRDIKPENVMLLVDGDLRLLDLGLAFLPGWIVRRATSSAARRDIRLRNCSGASMPDRAPKCFRLA